jgi:hypothetical protein
MEIKKIVASAISHAIFENSEIFEINFDENLKNLKMDSLDWVEFSLECEGELNINGLSDIILEWLQDNKDKKIIDLVQCLREIYTQSGVLSDFGLKGE